MEVVKARQTAGASNHHQPRTNVRMQVRLPPVWHCRQGNGEAGEHCMAPLLLWLRGREACGSCWQLLTSPPVPVVCQLGQPPFHLRTHYLAGRRPARRMWRAASKQVPLLH